MTNFDDFFTAVRVMWPTTYVVEVTCRKMANRGVCTTEYRVAIYEAVVYPSVHPGPMVLSLASDTTQRLLARVHEYALARLTNVDDNL
jgi:hypothetical protein